MASMLDSFVWAVAKAVHEIDQWLGTLGQPAWAHHYRERMESCPGWRMATLWERITFEKQPQAVRYTRAELERQLTEAENRQDARRREANLARAMIGREWDEQDELTKSIIAYTLDYNWTKIAKRYVPKSTIPGHARGEAARAADR